MVLALAASACGGGSGTTGTTKGTGSSTVGSARAANQTLTINIYGQPRTFDPGQMPTLAVGDVLRQVYTEALLNLAPDGVHVVGAAASSYSVSSDGLTYTFHLRSDGRFNNGQPVTAQDFVYAWRRIIDPRLASSNSRSFASVLAGGTAAASLPPSTPSSTVTAALSRVGLRAPDPRTFVVTLARPDPAFKYLATNTVGAPLLPSDVARYGSAWADKPSTLVTNGPFRVLQIPGPGSGGMGSSGASITLGPNHFYRHKPLLHRIVALGLGGQNGLGPAWTKYLSGELDISNGLSTTLQTARTTYKSQFHPYPAESVTVLKLNTTRPPFNNPKVRLAFARAVDRAAAVTLLSNGLGTPLTSLVPKGLVGYDPSIGAAQGYDPAAAKRLLAASGVSPSALQGIHVLVFNLGPVVHYAEALQAELKSELGIGLVIDTTQTPLVATRQGKFQVAEAGLGALSPDPARLFDAFLTGASANQEKWSDPTYDRLVHQADSTMDPAKRVSLYHQAEQILVSQAPAVFLEQPEGPLFIKTWVKGVQQVAFDGSGDGFPGDFYPESIYIARH